MSTAWEEPQAEYGDPPTYTPSQLELDRLRARNKKLEAVAAVALEAAKRCRYDGYALVALEEALMELDRP